MDDSRSLQNRGATATPGIADTELRFLGQVGAALWAMSSRGALELNDALGEAVELASVASRVPEGRGEFAARALLDRARAAGTLAFKDAVADPYWRIPLELRFLLAASHGPYRASYARLHRILSLRTAAGSDPDFEASFDTSAVQQLLWSARTQFAAAVEVALPRGAPARTPSCPQYDPREPWTQRFLDEELPVRERLFLQNHLMNCTECRAALESCRRLLSAIELQLVNRGVLLGSETADRSIPSVELSLGRLPVVLRAASLFGVAILLALLCIRG